MGKIGRGGRRGGEDGKIHHTVEKGQNDLVDLHNNPLIKHEVKWNKCVGKMGAGVYMLFWN